MSLIRPRLTDFYGIHLAQSDLDFVVPYLNEDIPFCVDPFLLYKSPSMNDQALHGILINSFNQLGSLYLKGKTDEAINILNNASEAPEVGLGFSSSRHGMRIGEKASRDILELFSKIPQLRKNGFTHLEEVQLLIEGISKDRISDFTCTFIKSFLIDYTMDQCKKHGIPTKSSIIKNIYDPKTNKLAEEKVEIPIDPYSKRPILLVPKRWIRKAPWISSDSYINGYYLTEVLKANETNQEKGEILNFNRHNYDVILDYIKQKERTQNDCKNDPLFTQIPVLSAKQKWAKLQKLPSGKKENADKQYEEIMLQLLASLLYPHLDFATDQVRTDSGAQIRDLIFYNNTSIDFLADIFSAYESRQLVFELKNVDKVEREHINQINRYMTGDFGRFGIIVTRNRIPRAMFKNTIDLWSGQRRVILCLDDSNIELMVNVFETKQREPIEILKHKYVEFKRACPV